ncbi:MAG: sugar kinase [Polyangiaceae bacterium UTPRO1]|jgi:sugar/nucleoside kinase (ribokinase family)|nr:PfkB family carbohydrate kinase [Myxococcales bacterium]OQY66940.1 MAG: sugar kinase [Polyangiaceae bacterium UTPRO1]
MAESGEEKGGALVVVGSVAIDTIETQADRAPEVLGGAATYFAAAASFFAPVRMVGVVGSDFPEADLDWLRRRGIDLAGLEVRAGRTMRWTGRYHEDMNVRDTLSFEANVFDGYLPTLPAAYCEAPYVFLANIAPELQTRVLDQMRSPRLVGADTMNLWIETARDELAALLRRVPLLIINDEEARLLSGERNVVRAARRILDLGPTSLMIKRGEYGVLFFSGNSVFSAPAYPLEEVFDPTGAGDTFAGGVMGYLAATGDVSPAGIRKAIVYGSVVASFTVEAFSLERLRALTRDDIERRYRQFVSLTSFDVA